MGLLCPLHFLLVPLGLSCIPLWCTVFLSPLLTFGVHLKGPSAPWWLHLVVLTLFPSLPFLHSLLTPVSFLSLVIYPVVILSSIVFQRLMLFLSKTLFLFESCPISLFHSLFISFSCSFPILSYLVIWPWITASSLLNVHLYIVP